LFGTTADDTFLQKIFL